MLKRKLTPLKMPSRKFSPNQKTVERGKRRTRMATCQMMRPTLRQQRILNNWRRSSWKPKKRKNQKAKMRFLKRSRLTRLPPMRKLTSLKARRTLIG